MILGVFIYFIIAVLLSLILSSKKGVPFTYWIQLTFVFPMAVIIFCSIIYFVAVR